MTLQEALKANELPLKIVHRTHGNITVIGKSTLVRHGMPDDSVYVAEPDDNVSRGPLRVYGSDKVKIWKEPCDHEPERNPNYPGLLAQICRNCGAKIRAEKWVECETKILA